MWRVRGAGAFAALANPRAHGGNRRRSGPVSVAFVPLSAGQGPSGPAEREAQGPSGPAERRAQGPSGPSEGGTQPAARPCVAFAIGRRVGPAVVRNRLRRRLRDELGALARDGRLTPGDYLVGVGPAAAGLDGPTLRGHLRTALGVDP